jgi:hypothetical protein
MGSWCKLRVGELVFDRWKDEPVPTLMALFTEAEKLRGPIPRARYSEFFDVDDEDPEIQSG